MKEKILKYKSDITVMVKKVEDVVGVSNSNQSSKTTLCSVNTIQKLMLVYMLSLNSINPKGSLN
jgi:hypothetical protein